MKIVWEAHFFLHCKYHDHLRKFLLNKMKCKDADLLNKTSTSSGDLLSFPSRLQSALSFQNYR